MATEDFAVPIVAHGQMLRFYFRPPFVVLPPAAREYFRQLPAANDALAESPPRPA